MNAYFAIGAGSVAARLLAGHRALASFAYIGTTFLSVADLETICANCSDVMLDSGAFTAWKQGKPIDIAKYIQYIRDNHYAFGRIAALDDIESSARSVENWRAMLAALPECAHKIIPVWHEGEPFGVLDEYIATAHIIGVGCTEGRRVKQKKFEVYDSLFNRHPKARVHAFGCSEPQMLEPYPFESFDSTTWERDSAYANKHGWPWSRVSKETRQRAYIEAITTIEYRPVQKQQQVEIEELIHRSAVRESAEAAE